MKDQTNNLIGIPIHQRTLIFKPRTVVFPALATAEGFDQWFTRGTILEERTGGS